MSHGNYEKSRSVLATYHANGHLDDDRVRLELSNISVSSEFGESQPPHRLALAVRHTGEQKTPRPDDSYRYSDAMDRQRHHYILPPTSATDCRYN